MFVCSKVCLFVVMGWVLIGSVALAGNVKVYGLENISNTEWQRLQDTTFYFGHQSVGANILDGVKLIEKEYPQVKLVVQEGNTKNQLQPGVLLESRIGQNGDPLSKMKMFKKLMDDGLGGVVNVALFKFCFIDFNAHTDAVRIFAEYKSTMKSLQARYPETLFLHATVPLVSVQRGPKAWIKKILGRPLDGVQDNIVRYTYNELLRKEYAKPLVFDIARAEATKQDGTLQEFTSNGAKFYAMAPEYTTDGGHLNDIGSKHVASRFLELLVRRTALLLEKK